MIKTDCKLVGVGGKVIKDGSNGHDLTFRDIVTAALLAQCDVPAEEKYKRYALAKEIQADDIVLDKGKLEVIKTVVEKHPPNILGAIYDILEQAC